jgi:UDPglucose 6-dehydrogenase
MNICVFGTTLQAGVIAGLFAEYGHQVYWCPQIATENQTSVHYQDENLNQLIHKQIKNHSLQLVDLKEINLTVMFSF